MNRHSNRSRYTFPLLLLSAAVATAEPLPELRGLTYGGDNRAHFEVLAQIRSAAPSVYGAIEARLLSLLGEGEWDVAAIDSLCDALCLVGSEASLPAMIPMLHNEERSIHALRVLQSVDSPRVDETLRAALDTAPASVRISVVTTLGLRRDRLSVEPIEQLLTDSDDPDLISAGLYALGRIGSEASLDALRKIEPSRLRDEAELDCAYQLLESGARDAASGSFARLAETGATPAIRTGALRGYLLADPAQALSAWNAALSSTNLTIAVGAASVSRDGAQSAVTTILIDSLASSPPALQQAILRALADRGDPAAVSFVLARVASEDSGVQREAILACERFGGIELVEPLLAIAGSDSPNADAARFVLGRNPSSQITAELQKRLGEEDADLALLIRILDARNAPPDLAFLMAVAKAGEPAASAAFDVMSRTARAEDVPRLRPWMNQLPAQDQMKAAGVLLDATESMQDPDARFRAIAGGTDQLSEETRAALMALAPRIGGRAALSTLEGTAAGTEGIVQDAAVRALCKWNGPEAAAPLGRLLSKNINETQRVLIIRSLVPLFRDGEGYVPERIAQLEMLRDDARQPEELALIDSAIESLRDLQ